MKNLSVLINIILIAAVGFLYVKMYTHKEEAVPVISGKAAASKLVFVNSDSLMDNYELFKLMKEKIEKKRDSLDNLLTAKGRTLQKDIEVYQETAGNMTAMERQSKEEILSHRQQQFVAERDGMLDKLKVEEDAMTDSIHADLVGYLKNFNKAKGFDFILGYSRGGGILLANDSLDITKQVIDGLNVKK